MQLEQYYNKIKQLITKIDFNTLWENFKPLKYALYNNKQCFFDGNYIDKTADFLANTSICYKGEYIAIWNMQDDCDANILTSKIVHEMFHGFQMINGETRFPNELEALYQYQYTKENLAIKHRENSLICQLIEKFDQALFNELLSLRKYRLLHFPYEYQYEAMIEQIEGTANYVELNVLKQLSTTDYQNKLNNIINRVTDINSLIPVRIISYDIGALLLMIMRENNIRIIEGFSNIPFAVSMLNGVGPTLNVTFKCEEMSIVINNYYKKGREIVANALKLNNCVLLGEYKLIGVNIYNAVYLDDYIISTYFLMYEDQGENKILEGNFIIKIKDANTIEAVYKY